MNTCQSLLPFSNWNHWVFFLVLILSTPSSCFLYVSWENLDLGIQWFHSTSTVTYILMAMHRTNCFLWLFVCLYHIVRRRVEKSRKKRKIWSDLMVNTTHKRFQFLTVNSIELKFTKNHNLTVFRHPFFKTFPSIFPSSFLRKFSDSLPKRLSKCSCNFPIFCTALFAGTCFAWHWKPCHAGISSIDSRAEKIRTSCCHLKFSENLNGASVCFLVRSEETELNAMKKNYYSMHESTCS